MFDRVQLEDPSFGPWAQAQQDKLHRGEITVSDLAELVLDRLEHWVGEKGAN